MNKQQIMVALREILNRVDTDSDSLINRKKSYKHTDEIQVLIEHISILIFDLKFDAEATRRELFEIRSILEE